jgi:hypothetical protein
MSSAILYLAIIAIWLCVLIPRWLKRDSARSAIITADPADGGETPVTVSTDADQAELAVEGTPGDAEPGVTGRRPAAPALSAAEARRRIMSGRRRLLGMLILLEIAAIALAVVGLAALWVIIPPTIMLTGYLLLLREAGHADAERAQREAEAAAHARQRAKAKAARERARAQAAQRSTPAEGTPMEAAELAAKFAAAPVPADYEDSGRDFAPGLAGKYTTSNADPEAADDNVYEIPRLRAVGD